MTPAEAVTSLSAVERISRDESARILATLIRACGGDFQLAEDVLQDALAAAVQRWPREGEPRDPVAWIYATARRKAIDHLRRERTAEHTRESLARLLAVQQDGESAADEPHEDERQPDGPVEDDRLRLIFTCCHPALALEARVALTLRTVARLETGEIARAFLVSEPTMAQRLVRAKRKIRDAGIPYGIPHGDHLRARLGGVLAVIYLIFNEGYEATSGETLFRPELCAEAIRLARLVAELRPGEPEAIGLLALMLLHDARRASRIDADGDLVTLDEQDRSLWDREQIAEGTRLVDSSLRQRQPGPFQIQAAIAALHAEAPTAELTDWLQIALLYRELDRHVESPVVTLNWAAAVSMVKGAEAGLQFLNEIAPAEALSGYHLYHATRADLLRQAGRLDEAATAYRRALDICKNGVEARYLRRRLSETVVDDQR